MSQDGLEIIKIKNLGNRTAARIADIRGDKDGYLDKEEMEVFKQNAEKEKYKSWINENEDGKKEYQQILGYYSEEENKGEAAAAPAVTNPQNGNNGSVVTADPVEVSAQASEQTEATGEQSAQKSTTPEEEKYNKRFQELASVSVQDLKKAKMFGYTDVSQFKSHASLTSDKITLYDLLKDDYLNKDLAENKDGKLEQYLREKNPNATDEEIANLLQAEMTRRQKRFNDNGTYNLQELAPIVIQRATVGTDYTLNQSKQDMLTREHSNVLFEFMQEVMPGVKRYDYYKSLGIGHALGGDESGIIKDKDIKMAEGIVEFFGGTLEKYNFRERHSSEPLKNGAQQAVSNALVQACNPLAYAEQTQVTNIVTDIGVQNVLQHQLVITGPLNALLGAAASLGVAEIDAAIKNYYGELKDEEAVIQIDPLKGLEEPKYVQAREDLEAFRALIDSDKSCDKFKAATKEALKELAGMFTYQNCTGRKDDKGEWIYETKFDYQEMYSYLREIGGNDTVNMQELASSYITDEGRKILKQHIDRMIENAELRNQRCQDCTTVQVVVVEYDEQEDEGQPDQNGQVAMRELPYHTKDATHSTWAKLTESYDCLRSLGDARIKDAKAGRYPKMSVRILKMVQCIGDGDYSKARIDKLLEIVSTAKTDAQFRKALADNNIDFDYDLYLKIVYDPKYAMPGAKTKMPKELYGCEYQDIDLRVTLPKEDIGSVGSFGEGVRDKTQYRYREPNGPWVPCDEKTYNDKKAKGYEVQTWEKSEQDIRNAVK